MECIHEERGVYLTRNVHFEIDSLALIPDLLESRKQLFNVNQPTGQIIFSSTVHEVDTAIM